MFDDVLNVFGVEKLFDLWPDDVRLGAGEAIENVLIGVECAQGSTLILINVQTCLHRFRLVIIALNQRLARLVVDAGHFWRAETGIVDAARGQMRPARGQTLLIKCAHFNVLDINNRN